MSTEAQQKYSLQGGTDNHLAKLSEDDALQRLQAMLSQWLRMENVAVLMGAGCSVTHGGKLMGSLEDAVLSFLASAYDATEDTVLADIVKRRRFDADIGLGVGFEEWLSFVANASYILGVTGGPVASIDLNGMEGSISASADDLKRLMEDLRVAIMAFCALELPALLSEPSGHHALFGKLMARDPSLGRLHIYTTNYDTLIEQALDDLGAQYADGFVGRSRPRFDPSSYGLDIYFPGDVAEGRVRRFDKYAQLFKIHGSISWFTEGTETVQRHGVLHDLKGWRDTEGTPKERLEGLRAVGKRLGSEVAILPTANKFAQTLDLPYAHLFRAFGARLAQPQTFLIVAGYGFGDRHINQIIDDAMANPGLVLLVVDPCPGQATKKHLARYQAAGERAYLLTAAEQTNPPSIATFDDFAKSLLPNVRWLDDLIALRKLEKTLATATGAPAGGKAEKAE